MVVSLIALSAVALGLVTWKHWQNGQANTAYLNRQLAGIQMQIGQVSRRVSAIPPPKTITSLAANGNDVTTIVYNQYGFDPNMDTVQPGTGLTIENNTTLPLYIQALDWYGRAIGVSPLNLGTIAAGQSASFVMSSQGAYQYQADHNPAIRGEIEVQ